MKTKLAGTRFRCRECSHFIHIPSSQHLQKQSTAAVAVTAVTAEVAEESAEVPGPVPSSGVGSPPRSEAETYYSRSSPSLGHGRLRTLTRRIPWRILASCAAGLLIGVVIMKLGQDAPPDTGQETKSPEAEPVATQDGESVKELPKTLTDAGMQLKPGTRTISLMQMLDRARLQTEAENPLWRIFDFPNQPISILMPGRPQPTVRNQGGIVIKGAAVDFTRVAGGSYSVMYIDVKVDKQPFDVKETFTGMKLGMLNAFPGAQVTDEKDISITDAGGNVHPGREFRIVGSVEGHESTHSYRIFLVGPKIIISYTGIGQQHISEFESKSAKFLDSLKITDSVPPVTPGG